MHYNKFFNMMFFVITLFTFGCNDGSAFNDINTAVVSIQPTNGNRVSGVVTFKQEKNKVRISGTIKGLESNAKHGWHIHQYGDLRSDNGKSAGGHYNPAKHDHALPPTTKRHAGSFGNLNANEDGIASFDFLDDTISVAGEFHPIIGRSLIIHAKPDTGAQPAGNAGSRIGFGVIGIAKN